MHIYFSGIGGVGLGPLAHIAVDAGYDVSGSDMEQTPMFIDLQSRGVNVHQGQEVAILSQLHAHEPIDWFVYTSALPYGHPELEFARANGIKATKRDELLAQIIKEKDLKLIAISGTHGKTTTTAMVVWLFVQLGIPVSYSVGTTLSFGASGVFDPSSQYFVYECDEFDKNFLHFQPYISLIPSQSYDHSDTYPTQKDYDDAFMQFKSQSDTVLTWRDVNEQNIHLPGHHNRINAALAIKSLELTTKEPVEKLQKIIDSFPGSSRRFEKLAEHLYSDYAHHPEEIEATLQLANELSDHIVVVYQPHQNIRQHQVTYTTCFDKAEKVYWLPTYLSREDPSLEILTPQQLTSHLANEKIVFANLDSSLETAITQDINKQKLVIIMGAGSIDTWARQHLTSSGQAVIDPDTEQV